MPVDDSTLTKRYALKIALIYLIIRCIPELVLVVLSSLPPETLTSLVESHGTWLRYVYPIMPVLLLSIPFAFQQALALLPVLIIEVLLVFLFSAWFLRRKPWAVSSTNKSRWIILILATAVWSYAIRHQLLAYIQTFLTGELLALRNEANWKADDLPLLMMKANWSLTAVFYVTTPLWAWLPAWLHFRFTNKPGEARGNASATEMAIPLQRAIVFTSFLLGSLVLHLVLVQVTFMGLWPLIVELPRISVLPDLHNETGLPLSLSQIVLATLMCAVAAYVYVRRPLIRTGSVVQLVIKPWLAGIVAYLLTCFFFLALFWFVIWLNPEFANSLLQQFSLAPEGGILFIIAFNIGVLVLLCFMSGRLRVSPRRWGAVLAVFILCAAVPSYVGWTIIGSNMGIKGGTPGVAVTGALGDARWRNMEPWCTGIVETSHGTWLIGQDDDATDSAFYVPSGVPDLSKLLTSEEKAGVGVLGSRPVLTTLALLQGDGTFKIMATIPAVACMAVSPTSQTLFLLTGVERSGPVSSQEQGQTAIFRSLDHGATWEWMSAGFMPEVQQLAWRDQPTFSSEQDVWAWGTEPPSEDGTELKPTALFYSADHGQTSTVIYGPEPLVVPGSYLREMTGEPTADFSNRRDMDKERHIVQVSNEHAYAWVSEFAWYYVGEDTRSLMLTTRAELSRSGSGGEWEITKVTRLPHVRVRNLSTSLDGRTYAVLHDKDGEWLVKLDTQTGEWIARRETPSLLPSWLAEDRATTRYFRSNGDYQVVSQSGKIVIPRLLIPFSKERLEIHTNTHFYTRDGGRNWHQLAIPGYLGVMGLSPRGSRVYWNKGNRHRNDEPLQWQYDLAK